MKKLSIILILSLFPLWAAGPELTADKIQELSHLSTSYKAEYSALKTNVGSLESQFETLYQEQLRINQELLTINESLKAEKEKSEKHKIYMWLGIGGAALLGMVSP